MRADKRLEATNPATERKPMRDHREAIAELEDFANRPAIDNQPSLWLSEKLSLTADAAAHLSKELEARGHEVPIETCLSVASEQVSTEINERVRVYSLGRLMSPEFSDNIWAGYYRLLRYLKRDRRNDGFSPMN